MNNQTVTFPNPCGFFKVAMIFKSQLMTHWLWSLAAQGSLPIYNQEMKAKPLVRDPVHNRVIWVSWILKMLWGTKDLSQKDRQPLAVLTIIYGSSRMPATMLGKPCAEFSEKFQHYLKLLWKWKASSVSFVCAVKPQCVFLEKANFTWTLETLNTQNNLHPSFGICHGVPA